MATANQASFIESSRRYIVAFVVASALMVMLACYHSASSTEAVILSLISVVLVAIMLIDIRYYIIPDSLQLALAALLLAQRFYMGQTYLLEQLGLSLALVALFASLRLIISRCKQQEALGLGDVKFVAVAGIALSWEQLSLFLLISGILGTTLGVIWQKITGSKLFPFGPALAAALLICIYSTIDCSNFG